MDIEDKNYYEILEIPFSCTQEEIHQAYNRAKNAYDGDSAALYSLLTEQDCQRIISAIEEAYAVLGAPDKRMQYDKARGFDEKRATEDKMHKSHLEEVLSGVSSSHDSLMNHEKNLQQAKKDQVQREEFEYKEKPKESVSRAEAYSKFALIYENNTEMDQEIENAVEYPGHFLQKVREYKQVSIERMAEMTKVSKTHIRNIEAQDIDKLPATVYVRGFIFQYAKCLKLNPDLVCKSYLQIIKHLREQEI